MPALRRPTVYTHARLRFDGRFRVIARDLTICHNVYTVITSHVRFRVSLNRRIVKLSEMFRDLCVYACVRARVNGCEIPRDLSTTLRS